MKPRRSDWWYLRWNDTVTHIRHPWPDRLMPFCGASTSPLGTRASNVVHGRLCKKCETLARNRSELWAALAEGRQQ